MCLIYLKSSIISELIVEFESDLKCLCTNIHIGNVRISQGAYTLQ